MPRIPRRRNAVDGDGIDRSQEVQAMRKALIVAAIALSTVAARPAAAADPSGDWMVENGSAIIRIAKCGDLYWASSCGSASPAATAPILTRRSAIGRRLGSRSCWDCGLPA